MSEKGGLFEGFDFFAAEKRDLLIQTKKNNHHGLGTKMQYVKTNPFVFTTKSAIFRYNLLTLLLLLLWLFLVLL